MAQANKIVTIKLDADTKDKLNRLSKAKARSPHWLMKKAIDNYVEKEEAQEKLRQETLARWTEAELDKVVSNDEVVSWLESWGTKEEKERP
jgi:predicted transcriptional regulator